MDARLIFAAALASACYTLGPPAPAIDRVFVEVRDQDGVDVGLAAEVAGALRSALAERFELAPSRAGAAVLEVSLSAGPSGLSALADPSLRSAEYSLELALEARLSSASGEALWRSGPITGQASYLGGQGALLRLEGDRRLALGRASEEAARRLASALLYAR